MTRCRLSTGGLGLFCSAPATSRCVSSCEKCDQCAAGEEEHDVSGQVECHACAAGYFNPTSGGTCQQCTAGSEVSADKSTCDACQTGYYNPTAGGTCAICGAGHQTSTLKTSCDLCDEGYSNPSSGSVCVKCPDDTESNANRQSCTPCSYGSSRTGDMTRCMKCLPGWVGPHCEVDCNGKCSGHGVCNYDDITTSFNCTCDPGWRYLRGSTSYSSYWSQICMPDFDVWINGPSSVGECETLVLNALSNRPHDVS